MNWKKYIFKKPNDNLNYFLDIILEKQEFSIYSPDK